MLPLKKQCQTYTTNKRLLKDINLEIQEVEWKLYGIRAKNYDAVSKNKNFKSNYDRFFERKENLIHQKNHILNQIYWMEEFLFHQLSKAYQDIVWCAYIERKTIPYLAKIYQFAPRTISLRLYQANKEYEKYCGNRGESGA